MRCNMTFLSYDAIDIMMTLALVSCGTTALVSTSCDVDSTISHHCIPNQNEIQYDVFGYVTTLTLALATSNHDNVLNGTTAFFIPRQLK